MTEELKQYISARQTDALLLESILSAAMAAIGAGRTEMLYDLIDGAHDVANQLNRDLDAVSLPQGGAA